MASMKRRSSALAIVEPLPETILMKIFGYLSLPDLMKLRRVSKRWRKWLQQQLH